MNKNDFIALIQDLNYNMSMLSDTRYDLVLHLRTAALGAID